MNRVEVPAKAKAPEVVFVAELIERRVGVVFDRPDVLGSPITASSVTILLESQTFALRSRFRARRGAVDPGDTVSIEYCVDETGRVSSARAAGGNTLLADAAIETVKTWHFAPYFVADRP